ncbi:MAG: TIGR04283 family arsenosugar biosynthesis glycosyltransferase [Thermodesulfobacteriota bacterium]
MTELSIIIPAFNEAGLITQTLSALQPLRAAGNELIVVDGGSSDDTIALSKPLADRIVRSARGRSRQMNAGARISRGEVLLFLHADTLLPEGADQLILCEMEKRGRNWGRFDIRLSGRHLIFRVVELLMNLRSRITGIATGDQAIFVQRKLFETVGGFPEVDLMEDIAMSKFLNKCGPPLCLWQRVVSSSRRWQRNGIVRTILTMWSLRLAYFYKAEPGRLAQVYESRQESRRE